MQDRGHRDRSLPFSREGCHMRGQQRLNWPRYGPSSYLVDRHDQMASIASDHQRTGSRIVS